MDFPISIYILPFLFLLNKAIYFGQLILPSALTDRHFVAEHFGILFAFFGLMVQKLSNFKVQLNFLPFYLFPGIWPRSFRTGPELARVADRWGSGHGGRPRRPEAHCQV